MRWENITELEAGDYECRVYSVWEYPAYYCPFKVLPEGEEFTYDTEKDRFRNVQAMEELNLQTHDEIEELYYEFMSVMKESLYYMTNLYKYHYLYTYNYYNIRNYLIIQH